MTAHPNISEQLPLAGYTTIGLGGPARFFMECSGMDDLREGIAFAGERRLPLLVLGGGSNIVVSDDGFPGVVLHQASRGIEFTLHGRRCGVRVAGGESWDDVVAACVQRNLGGLECLSGIPGTAGATPVQNVGAYGQEVAETITAVHALDLTTLRTVSFTARECEFGNRRSRFKGADAGKYIITGVDFDLPVTLHSTIRYAEIARAVESDSHTNAAEPSPPTLRQTRTTVLRLRATKGMLIDPNDPESRSVGSFFMNPVVSNDVFAAVQARWESNGNRTTIPSFASDEGVKIPAAWLVEHAGFPRGSRRGGVGVSSKHALALVNYNGSTHELLAFAEEIRSRVSSAFGLVLEMEPVIVGCPATKETNG